MLGVLRADIADVSALLPAVGQLARVVAGDVNLVAVVDGIDRGSVVLDVHGVTLPAGPARLTFNSTFGGVLLAGQLHADGRATRFSPNTKGARFEQRRETFRVVVGLPAMLERAGRPPLAGETLNLSIGGVLLETEGPFPPAGGLTITIQCTPSHAVSLPATVIRSELGAKRLAVAFANVGGRDERTLSLLVAAAQRRALSAR
jgi:PilZ domain-containing protein